MIQAAIYSLRKELMGRHAEMLAVTRFFQKRTITHAKEGLIVRALLVDMHVILLLDATGDAMIILE